MKKREKAPKPVFVDDGRTIADMDYEHITGYKSKEERKKHTEIRSLGLSRKERWAIYRAAFARYLPMFFCFIGALVVLLLAFYFAMRGRPGKRIAAASNCYK